MRSPDRVLTDDIVCPLILALLESTHISAESMALVMGWFGGTSGYTIFLVTGLSTSGFQIAMILYTEGTLETTI